MDRVIRNVFVISLAGVAFSSSACQRLSEPEVANPRVVMPDRNDSDAIPINDVNSHRKLAEHFEQLGDSDKAISAFTRVIDANDKRAYADRATIKMRTGDYREAIADFSEFIDYMTAQPLGDAHPPTRARSISRAYFNRGYCYAKLGDPDRAEDDYSEARRIMKPHIATPAT